VSYPYIPARLHGGTQSTISRIVIHATVSPCKTGGARNVAAYFQSRAAGGSAHYIVDPGEVIQCVKDDVIAYHAPPNTGTLGVELCDPQAGLPLRWQDDPHERMLIRAAALVRQLATIHKVPLVRSTALDLQQGKRGICGHVEVSRAFGKTDHGDPDMGGKFPWIRFMQLLTEEDDVALDAADVKKIWTTDGIIAAPDGSKTNPQWTPASHLTDIGKQVRALAAARDLDRVELTKVQNQLAEILTLLKAPPAP
jgi:hypothetical protein